MILKQVPGYRPPRPNAFIWRNRRLVNILNMSTMCSHRHTRTFQRNLIPLVRALVMVAKCLLNPRRIYTILLGITPQQESVFKIIVLLT
jgi:hypothetical protein